MAEANISVFKDQFRCPVCLDLLKDPVTVPCGHSFCMICITHCWNEDDQKRVYSCPQCRQTFTPRPALGNNVILAELVEKLKKTNFQSDGSGPSYAGPEDVECDVCTGRKLKASKSCLVCLEPYCQTHFEHHEGFRSGKCHKVTEATGRLQEMICSQHDRLEVFCPTAKKFICLLCVMDEHKNLDSVSAAVKKQRLVEDNQRNCQQRIEQKEKKLQELRETIKTHKYFESLFESYGSKDVITVSPRPSFDDVRKSVLQLKEKMDDFCAREIEKISGEDFHLFSLDPNTVNYKVCLSEENRKASGKRTVQQYPDHPDRFDYFRQVLCRESVSGRCYWEVEWSGRVRISMSYKSINTKGKTIDCMFGRNDESWCLLCSSAKFSFWHNNKQTKLPVVSRSSRIGVFVDHSAGILSFYSVSHTMTLIHRVHTTFTQPLYPGFLIPRNSKMKLLKF